MYIFVSLSKLSKRLTHVPAGKAAGGVTVYIHEALRRSPYRHERPDLLRRAGLADDLRAPARAGQTRHKADAITSSRLGQFGNAVLHERMVAALVPRALGAGTEHDELRVAYSGCVDGRPVSERHDQHRLYGVRLAHIARVDPVRQLHPRCSAQRFPRSLHVLKQLIDRPPLVRGTDGDPPAHQLVGVHTGALA